MGGEIAVAARFEQILVDAFGADKKKTLAVVSVEWDDVLAAFLFIRSHFRTPICFARHDKHYVVRLRSRSAAGSVGCLQHFA
jgi:hypothetical protein